MRNLNILEGFAPSPSVDDIATQRDNILTKVAQNNTPEVWKFCHSIVDLTTLSSNDSAQSVQKFAREAVESISKYPNIPPVASLCVYPPFVEVVGLEVDGTPLKITAVGGGFPASQTFMEVKALECAMAVESGADEVDIVLNVGMMLSGEYDEAYAEIAMLREECGEETTLKVILESGVLDSPELIYTASLLSARAGADFIKTSTGKVSPAATPEAAIVMCHAIKSYYTICGERIGFKVAGGIRTVDDAVLYYTVVSEILGSDWLSDNYFRIGASSLCTELVERINSAK